MVDVQRHRQFRRIDAGAAPDENSPIVNPYLASSSLVFMESALVQKALPSSTKSGLNIANLSQCLVQIMESADQLDALLSQVTTAIAEAFQVDGCMIVFSTQPHMGMQVSYWLANADSAPMVCFSAPPISIAGQFFHAKPLCIADINERSIHSFKPLNLGSMQLWQAVLDRHDPLTLNALLQVTTQYQGSANGMISLVRSHSYDWSAAEVNTLNTISHQVAGLLTNLQLQQQITQRSHYQTVVNQLTIAIRNSSDLGEILHLATEGTTQALQVDRGLLLRIKYVEPVYRERPSTKTPHAKVTVAYEWVNAAKQAAVANWLLAGSPPTPPAPPALDQSFWLSECLLCQKALIQSPKPIVVVGANQPNRDSSPTTTAILNTAETAALLIMPLESRGTVLGFLVFENNCPRTWRAEEIELAELIGAQVSTAIIQTETLRQVQSLVERRTAELQHSLKVQAKLYERTREQVEQLRQLNLLKDEFLDTVSHELRHPLTKMSLAIRMLRQAEISSDRRDQYLEILEQQCTQETNLVNDLLTLRELESKKNVFQPEEFNLTALVKELLEEFQKTWAIKGLTLESQIPQDAVSICSDRESIHRILLELLTNSGKYSHPNSTIYFSLAYQSAATEQLTISLTNTGAGISPEELPHIFDKFRRCQGATQNAIQGIGLGLALAQSLAHHLNGSITASSSPRDNPDIWETCFKLFLPQTATLTKP
jgi:signal transduction histidine kinase